MWGGVHRKIQCLERAHHGCTPARTEEVMSGEKEIGGEERKGKERKGEEVMSGEK